MPSNGRLLRRRIQAGYARSDLDCLQFFRLIFCFLTIRARSLFPNETQ